MRRCSVAILGFGGVGRAIASLLVARRDRYAAVYDRDVRLVGVRRSRVEAFDMDGLDMASFDGEAAVWRPASEDVVAASDVLIDAAPSDLRTGGAGLPAVEAMLARGRHAISVSKGALVCKGPGLRALAARTGAELTMSAAAGAALPVLDLLRYSLLGCEVSRIEGIFNATSNLLLDAMMERGLDLAQALDAAREAGTVDSDPRSDIEGWDTAAKLVILANFGLGAALALDDVDVAGMQAVTTAEVRDWSARGLVPKLVGAIRRDGQGLKADVTLRALPAADPLAKVSGHDKAARIATDAMGEIFVSGCGPEPLATAAAALKDLEHILAAR